MMKKKKVKDWKIRKKLKVLIIMNKNIQVKKKKKNNDDIKKVNIGEEVGNSFNVE